MTVKNIKKIFFLSIVFVFFASVSSANVVQDNEECCKSKNETAEENKTSCEKCIIEDDEYCIYNQCYFDKQYRILKKEINPDTCQEDKLNNIYLNFKQDLEIQCDRYLKAKNKLLELISADNKSLKGQKREVKYIQKDIKEKFKDYLSDTNEVLCKNQKNKFRKFKRSQNRKIKQIKKYGAIYKFPCP